MSIDTRAALVATIRTIDGGAGYAHDFSSADQVIDGRPPDGPRPDAQLAYVYQLDRTYTRGGGATLRTWDIEQRLGVSFYVPSPTQSGTDREDTLDAIADDLHRALSLSLITGGALASAGVMQVTNVAFGPFYGSQSSRKSRPVVADAVLTLLYIDDGGA